MTKPSNPSASDGLDASKLTQRIGLFGKQSFRLSDDELHVRVRQLTSGVEFAVPFREIEPTGTHIYKFPWISGAFSVVGLLGTIGCIAGWAVSEKRDGEAYLGFMIFTIALCVLCAIHAKQVFANSILFRSSKGLIVFKCASPTASEARAFIADLQHRVEEASSIEKKIIRAVLSTLREEGMLDEWQHRKALERFDVKPE